LPAFVDFTGTVGEGDNLGILFHVPVFLGAGWKPVAVGGLARHNVAVQFGMTRARRAVDWEGTGGAII
jgi:hypothetical protein